MATSNDRAVSVRVRLPDGASELASSWLDVDVQVLRAAAPWRTFRSYKGQRHYSGSFWSATEKGLVLYESRLELSRLLFADFDALVRGIVAQPFLLETEIGQRTRRHVPDFLLLTDSTPIVVDVKPRHRVTAQTVAPVLAWTRRAVESRGWRYEVWTEPPPVELANVRLLAGHRRAWLFDGEILEELRHGVRDDTTLNETFGSLPHRAHRAVRSAVLHLLWTQHFHVDLSRPLSSSTVLRVST